VRALVAAPGEAGGVALGEAPDPQPGRGRVVVAVRAVSLNRGEVRGLADATEGAVPGWDLAGEVVEAATDGTGPAVGTRVVGMVGSGAWAERAAVPVSSLATLPDEVSFPVASTLPVAGLTAQRAIAIGDRCADGRVLVTGAAGGVGHFAVQLAGHLGADVTAVVGRPERAAELERLGATRVSVGMPDGAEFDLVLEAVGGSSLAAALNSVAPGGCVVTYGCASGEPTTFDVRDFYRRSGARLHGFQLGPELQRAGPDAAHHDLDALARMVASGHLEVQVGMEVGWERAAEAATALLDRQVVGKAVLTID
jgi:NADPH:quinone reductase-like Zn-dependent oxidoreductase